MKTPRSFLKRSIVAPIAAAVLVVTAVAAVNSNNPENMIATDGAIEVTDGRHIQTITREMPFVSGSTLTLDSGNGMIVVSGWDKDQLYVSAEKQLERRVGGVGWILSKLNIPFSSSESVDTYFDQLDVDVRKAANGVEIETIFPKNTTSVNVSVHYEIKIPRNASLALRTSNGRVEVANIDGTVVARSSNGRIEYADITGPVEARTSNGKIVLSNVNGAVTASSSNGPIVVEHAGALEASHAISCTTSNGPIVVKLPGNSQFDVLASTSNGGVRTDFAVDGADSPKRKHLDGRVGTGGPRIELKTSNGSIGLEAL